jgi:hypothetical protein
MLRVGIAALEAEAFLVWPRLGVHRLARKLRSRARHSLRQAFGTERTEPPAAGRAG